MIRESVIENGRPSDPIRFKSFITMGEKLGSQSAQQLLEVDDSQAEESKVGQVGLVGGVSELSSEMPMQDMQAFKNFILTTGGRDSKELAIHAAASSP